MNRSSKVLKVKGGKVILTRRWKDFLQYLSLRIKTKMDAWNYKVSLIISRKAVYNKILAQQWWDTDAFICWAFFFLNIFFSSPASRTTWELFFVCLFFSPQITNDTVQRINTKLQSRWVLSFIGFVQHEILTRASFKLFQTIYTDYSVSSSGAIPFNMDLNYLNYSLGQELCESSVLLAMKLITKVVYDHLNHCLTRHFTRDYKSGLIKVNPYVGHRSS